MKNILEKEIIKINDDNQVKAREYALTVCSSINSIINDLSGDFYNEKVIEEELLAIFNESLSYMNTCAETPEGEVFGKTAKILSCILPVAIAGKEDMYCLRENLNKVRELTESITLQKQELHFQELA